MQTKPLIYGIVGFLIGGLLVSIAATTFDKTRTDDDMSMRTMITSLQDKTGDYYDKTFVSEMIEHHQGAIDMATMSTERAKHQEVKELSKAIIHAQQQEIAQMKQWQAAWGYDSTHASEETH